MTASVNNIFNNEIVGRVILILFVFLSVFFGYSLAQNFNVFAINKKSWLRRHQLVKEWILIIWLAFKSFLGDGVAMYQIILTYLADFIDTPGDIWIGFFHLVYVDKPDDLQVVLNNSNALQKSGVYNFLKKILGNGLITAPVSIWRRKRRLVSPLFTSRFVDGYIDIFNLHSTELVKKFEKHSDTNEYFDLWIPVSKSTLAMIWDVAVGSDFDITENLKETILNTIVKVTEAIGLRIYRIWLYPVFMFNLYTSFAGYKAYFRFSETLPKQIFEIKKEKFKRKQELIKKSSTDGTESVTLSYLEQLLKQNEEGDGLSEKEIIHEGNTILAAGSETNALTISFTLIMLAMNPEIQEKLYSEIIEFSGENNNDLCVEQIQKMTYLDQCIRETLRLFPPLPFTLRQATKSFQINDKFTVHENSHVIIPIIMVHRNPQFYPNPLKWNPNNFAADKVESRHKYSFLAFSGGARGCIGGKYAMLAVKVALIKILKNYRVDTDYTIDDIKIRLELLIRSASGYKIKMYSRKSYDTRK